ncbi:phosphatase PAP2 family protein [Acidihalobacter prosperus]
MRDKPRLSRRGGWQKSRENPGTCPLQALAGPHMAFLSDGTGMVNRGNDSQYSAIALPNPPIRAWGWLPPLVFLVLAVGVAVLGLNTAVFEWLNHLPVITGDALWANLTVYGNTVVAFALLLPWYRRHPEVVWAAILAALPGSLWVGILKPLIHHPRPAAVLPHHLLHVIGPRLLANSFPSGHTTTAFALSGVLALSYGDRKWRAACLGMAIMIGLSRSAVGAHWPMDVLGGALGGWLSAWIGVIWARHWNFGLRKGPRRVLAVFCLMCALALFVYPRAYPQARAMLTMLAIVLLGISLREWLQGRQSASHASDQH